MSIHSFMCTKQKLNPRLKITAQSKPLVTSGMGDRRDFNNGGIADLKIQLQYSKLTLGYNYLIREMPLAWSGGQPDIFLLIGMEHG